MVDPERLPAGSPGAGQRSDPGACPWPVASGWSSPFASRVRASSELQWLLGYSLDVLNVLEVDGTWRYTSPAGSQLLGYPRGFDPDGGIFSLVHPMICRR